MLCYDIDWCQLFSVLATSIGGHGGSHVIIRAFCGLEHNPCNQQLMSTAIILFFASWNDTGGFAFAHGVHFFHSSVIVMKQIAFTSQKLV